MLTVAYATASTFFGGPERQMLELARETAGSHRTVFISFPEEGLCRPFLDTVRNSGFEGLELKHDTPQFLGAIRELTRLLVTLRVDVLAVTGYKANLLGLLAARRIGIPVVSVSRGWTAESRRVRLYETLDRYVLRWMDRVVCVSASQAAKVRKAGVSDAKITVIRNAIRTERFGEPQGRYKQRLQGFFPKPPDVIVGAAGRLSPEKGFGVLVDAAAKVVHADQSVGFVLFGDGVLRDSLADKIAAHGLQKSFILAGFCGDLDHYLPHFDLMVLPSFTEGLPNVVLEAFAAGVPVVATAVGGTPEVIAEGETGYLVASGNADALAHRVRDLAADDGKRKAMGNRGRRRVAESFSFSSQALKYRRLFDTVTARCVAQTIKTV